VCNQASNTIEAITATRCTLLHLSLQPRNNFERQNAKFIWTSSATTPVDERVAATLMRCLTETFGMLQTFMVMVNKLAPLSTAPEGVAAVLARQNEVVFVSRRN
jgi:hypothetical protein